MITETRCDEPSAFFKAFFRSFSLARPAAKREEKLIYIGGTGENGKASSSVVACFLKRARSVLVQLRSSASASCRSLIPENIRP